MAEKRTVFLALDGSSNSEYALKWYLEKCRRPDDFVVGYHAWQQAHLPTFSLKDPFRPPTEEWEKIMREIRASVEKVENDFASVCQGLKINYKFVDECCSKPGEGIVNRAENEKADIIVMGTRGLSSLRRTVLGSVSDYVLHHSHTPVAVVPTPEESA